MNDLIEFLKSLTMTTVTIDKKYRETIPAILSKMRTDLVESDNDCSKLKRKRERKQKLGKDGLYPGEAGHIRKWWARHQRPASESDEKGMTLEETSYHVSCIRRRETQLQMIIILEIVALEPLARSDDNLESQQLPGAELPSTSRDQDSGQSTRKRNKHNLPVLLDVHADRLCIWQSTTLDDVKALAESQLASQDQLTRKADGASSDNLQDFCVDVILPLYAPTRRLLMDHIANDAQLLSATSRALRLHQPKIGRPNYEVPSTGKVVQACSAAEIQARSTSKEKCIVQERQGEDARTGPVRRTAPAQRFARPRRRLCADEVREYPDYSRTQTRDERATDGNDVSRGPSGFNCPTIQRSSTQCQFRLFERL